MSKRPRLLFVAPSFLFPRISGGRIRTTDVLRGMKGGAFEITLASPQPAGDRDWSNEIAAVCDRFVSWPPASGNPVLRRARNLASPLPVSVAVDRSADARRCIAGELALRPDAVVFDFAHTAILAPDEPLTARSAVFAHNVEHEILARNATLARSPLRRALWRSQSVKMKRFERSTLRRFDCVVAVSDRDAALLRGELGVANVRVVPTAIDTDFYSATEKQGTGDLRGGGTVVFTGSLNWMPNIDALEWLMEEAWAPIAAASPATRLVIVGREAPRRLVAEAARRRLAWTFTGFVDDVRPYLRAADVAVIPLRSGGGTRLKIYEAMALACPVVSTTIGVEGLPLVAGEHYLRADTPAEFAAATLLLLRDGARRRRLATAARAFVVSNFPPRVVGRAFEEICLELIAADQRQAKTAPRRTAARGIR